MSPGSMTIAHRLVTLVTVPLLILLAFAAFGRYQLSRIEAQSRFVAESRIEALAVIGRLSSDFEGMRVQLRSYLLAGRPAQQAQARARFADQEQEVGALLQRYSGSLAFSEEGRRLLGEFTSLSQEWLAGAREAMALADRGRRDEALARLDVLVPMAERLSVVSRQWVQNNEQLAASAGREVVSSIATLGSRMNIATVVGLLVMSALGYLTFLRIARPVRELETSVTAIAAGNYDKPVPFVGAGDETGGLARAIDLLKQGAGRTHELLEQTKKQDEEIRHVNFMAGSALDLTSAGYWRLPLDDSGWFHSNERTVRIFGDLPSPDHKYRVEGWLAHAVAGDPAAAEAANARFQDALSGTSDVYDATYAYKRPVDGRVIWIHAVGHVVRDAAGRPTDMFGAAQDVTEFKLAEQRIRETEQFYGGVLELAPDGLMVVDEHGVIRL